MSNLDLPANVEDHSFLAEELLIPFVNRNDGSRTNMSCNQFSQVVILDNAEPPLVFTGFEKQCGEVSTGIRKFKNSAKVLKIFNRNSKNSILFLENKKGEIDVEYYFSAVNLTESFGYLNSKLDKSITEGAKVSKGQLITKNGMYDDNHNLQYGVNLRTIYLPFKGMTYEDPVVISESASKKLSHTNVFVFSIMLNKNDVLVQDIPSVGESTDNVLCAIRRIVSDQLLADFKDSSFKSWKKGDTIYRTQEGGIVEDIEVFSNSPEELELPYNSTVKKAYLEQQAFYTEVLEYIEGLKKDGKKLTEEVLYLNTVALDFLSVEKKFTYDKNEFEGTLFNITVSVKVEAPCGNKLTGR